MYLLATIHPYTTYATMLFEQDNRLVYRFDSEQVWVEPWGPNAFRIRATRSAVMPSDAWALDEQPPFFKADISLSATDGSAGITHGKARVQVTKRGKITIFNHKTGEVVLEEYARNRRDIPDPNTSALEIEPREFKPIHGGDSYRLTMRFESTSNEKIFGMGQYQQPFLDLKGLDIELAHRNSQASVPFALSSLGYGILWNNPSVGRAVFGKNITTFEASSTKALDYWIVVGDTPAEIVQAYAAVTGKPPMMPEYGLGFWQCKLRYESQDELLQVAREYKKRELPIDVIVIDFCHWPLQGDWKFDERYYPDPGKAEALEPSRGMSAYIFPRIERPWFKSSAPTTSSLWSLFGLLWTGARPILRRCEIEATSYRPNEASAPHSISRERPSS